MTASVHHPTSKSAGRAAGPFARLALVVLMGTAAGCGKSPASPPITPIAACPEGATLVGDAPPKGLRQRCQKSDSERHGATRAWYDNGRERTYSEWWNGNKHGRFTLWFKDGRVRSEGAHRHGAAAGRWKYYREDGTLQQEQTFSVEPPPADWLAQAIAGHPPAPEAPASGSAAGSAPPTADPDL